MAYLNGHSSAVAMVATTNPGTMTADPGPATTTGTGTALIDGTPIRVCMLALAGAAGLFALKLGGLRFNVGVSA